MFTITEIAERVRTQDNRITADPIFLVQELERIYGIDTNYDPKIAWLYEDESVEVDKGKAKRLENRYEKDGDDNPSGYRRVGYAEEWRYVQPFFTEAAALHYCATKKHHHKGALRVYADSGYPNPEWKAMREHLKSIKAAEHA
jgi:hypothetical protein